MLKLVDGSLIVWGETGYLYSLRVSFHMTPINYKGKSGNCTVKQSERQYLNQVIRINITSNGIIRHHVPSDMNWDEQNIASINMILLLKICNSNLMTSDKSSLRNSNHYITRPNNCIIHLIYMLLLFEVILCQHKFNTFNISVKVQLYFLYFAYKIYIEGKLYSYDSFDSITGFEFLT